MKLPSVMLTGAVLALPSLMQAEQKSPMFTGHYPAGVEGIKGGSLPPPGFYLRDYNVFYNSGRLTDNHGDPMGVDFDAFVYANVIRGIWVSNYELLGGNYFMDALVPFQYTDLEVNGWKDSEFGLGDVYVEPIGIAWHGPQWDAAVGYSVWIPTGESQPGTAEPGKGFWGHMLTFGGTYYFDHEKTWALSVLNRYEINCEEEDTDITPGQQWTIEWGLSKSIKPTIDVGLIGYYQLQTTKDSGPHASDDRDQVLAFGPEISVLCPHLGLFTSLRYNWEVMSENRNEGHTFALTFTKAF